jgi:hypothetical protein
MSTGLTWVTLWDYSGDVRPFGGVAIQQFSDYSEALAYMLYNARLMYVLDSTPNSFFYVLYTTSPNQNGFVAVNAAPFFQELD